MSSNANYVQDDGVESGVNTSTTSTTQQGYRKSHTWCGKVADTRKGVFIVDIFNIFAILFSVLFQAIIYHERHFGGYFAGLLGVVLSCIGAYGALKFDYRITGIATVGFFACFVIDFVFLNFIGVIIDLVILYPHAYFTYENYRGILTKETYHNEEFLMEGLPDVKVPTDV
jgi:hypothetical protein